MPKDEKSLVLNLFLVKIRWVFSDSLLPVKGNAILDPHTHRGDGLGQGSKG